MASKEIFQHTVDWCDAVLKVRNVSSPEKGICDNLERWLVVRLHAKDTHDFFKNFLFDVFEAWPKYSGDPIYPVAGAWEYDTAEKWRGSSLELRLDLVKHIRDCAIKMLED